MTNPQYPGTPGQQPHAGPGQQPYGAPSGGFPAQSDPGQPYGAPSGGFPAPPAPGQPAYPSPSGGFPGQQPYPGQPSYPGGFAGQPYPAAPYPATGYGMQPPQPNGATAIIAGILAVLGGLASLLGLIAGVIGIASLGFLHWLFVVALVENLILVGTLLPGGILLFLRKPVGRLLTIIGSGFAIFVQIATIVLDVVGIGHYSAGLLPGFLGLLLTLAPAIATLVLAIVKPTALWCAPRPR
ncbi:hypothetical protein [Amycolatopsis kentuckyensis]|uniref:hypothetical protein n=1 Tax=Amycolatopsis kentuckyensis TaxID=218823 RepID=UPI00356829B1